MTTAVELRYPLANAESTGRKPTLLSNSGVAAVSSPDTAENDAYADWKSISGGADGIAYLATHRLNGSVVELRVVRPIAADKELVTQLRRRVRLADLCATALVRRAIEVRLDDSLPMMVIERPCLADRGEMSLSAAIDAGHVWDRVTSAREVIASLRIAHRLGLFHGHLSAVDVILGSDGHVRLDFTGLNVNGEWPCKVATWTFATAIERGEIGDLVDLKLLLRRLLGDDKADLTKLQPRSRAALRSMLRAEQTDESAVPSLAQWEEVLGTGRVAPLLDDPHGTMEIPATTSVADQPSGKNVAELAAKPEVAKPDMAATCDTKVQTATSLDATGDMQPGNLAADPMFIGTNGPLAARSLPEPGMMLGRYRLDAKLGQGAMGIVFRGTDLADESQVAIKVLWTSSRDTPQSIRRFQKEARLLAGVQNDYVTRLHEVGEDGGFHFLAMEYVEGTTLKHWLAESGALDEKTSLSIIGDIAKALVEAHAKGIIHRDIKPENVLLQNIDASASGLLSKRVKLSDFGIARQVDQSASLDVTQAGALLGTPRYMSPEQCRGTKEIGPQADVYSLGITLYEMLAGAPPFDANDALKLVAMHCFDPAPSIQKKVSTVSDLTSQIVARALAKEPGDRFADAAQMLASVQRVLRGEVSEFEMHPRLPKHDPAKLWQKTFSWDLESSSTQLWPYVSNTERLNRAIGLPAVTYRTENDPKIGLRKFGSFKLSGVSVSWEEHPFEWIEGSRMGILREFDAGPFKWFMSIVELKQKPDGGTRLEHQIRIEPRNWVGRVMTTIEADWRGGKNLDRVYKRIDQTIQKKLDEEQGRDAFEPAQQPKKNQKERIKQRGERLLDRGVDAETAAKLTNFIATAPPQVVAQIRPLTLAAQLQVNSDDCLNACLYAAAEGLLVLRWEILCPTCRVSASAESLLSAIKDHTHCVACDYDFRSDLGEAIELVFRAHPEVREVDDAVYCIAGPEHSPHVAAQIRLEASDRVELEVKLSAGDYLIRGPRLVGQQRFRVRSTPAPSSLDISISELGKTEHTPVLCAGRQTLVLTNDLDHLQVMRVERMIPRDDVVTASRASTLALFRELFPDQVMGQNKPIAADEVTLVATSVFDVDSLYANLGDRDAYELIGRHLDVLRACVESYRGTIAKTVGEGVLAAFADCEHAVDAALAMQAAINEEPSLRAIRLSIGVNRGRTLVATLNQRLDYFGATARLVSALPDFAAGDLLLTESVFGDPQVQQRLRSRGIESKIETVHLPGRPNQVVQRVSR